MNKILHVICCYCAAGVLYTGHPGRLYLGLLFQTHASVTHSVGSGKGEKTISSIQIKMKFSVDVQTESCIFPCNSSVNHESFRTKAILWDIQVINVKSNLFNNSSTYEVDTEQSINDNEDKVNVSKHNDQVNGIKETLVRELTSANEPLKTIQEEDINKETINQSAERRTKTQGSYKEGKENGKYLNTNINIKNKTEDEEQKTKNGATEEQAGIQKDVENKEDAKIMINIKPNYEDTKCSVVTENNGHTTRDYKNKDSVNEESNKIQEHKEYKNDEMCIGQEVNKKVSKTN